MAYGFQNTCDTDEYFYLDNVPGYVSVGEYFYIETLEGENFCGEYVNIPSVDYQILTYTLLGMTAQTNASACQQINPCPTVLINFGNQNTTTASVNVCACLTEYPLGVGCVVPNVTPQNPNVQVNLKISGGTAPYTIYSANTSNQLDTVSVNGGTSQINTTRPSGTYCFDVYDFYQTKVSHCCTVSSAATLLSATYSKVNTNQCYNSGSVTVNINGGTPPYTVYRNGGSQGETTQFTGLGTTSTNTFYVTDSSTPMQQTSPSNQNITVTPITYPTDICMSFTLCGPQFNLSFSKSPTANCPPAYICSNPEEVGSTGIFLTGDTSTNTWGTTEFSVDSSQMNLPGNCSLSSSTGRFVKTSSSQQAAGGYTGQGAFAQATNITITNGICQNPPTFTTTVQNTCAGSSSGVITVVPQGGTPPYTVVFNNIEYPTQTIFNNLAAGSYTISVLDSLNLESSSSIYNVTNTSIVPYTQLTQCQTIVGDDISQNNYGNVNLKLHLTFNAIPPGNTITIGGFSGSILISRTDKTVTPSGNMSYTFQGIRIYKNNNTTPIVTSNVNAPGNFGASSLVQPPICTSNFWRSTRTDNITNSNINTDITIINGDSLIVEFRAYIGVDIPSGTMPPPCYNALTIKPSFNFTNVTDDIPNDVCYNNNVPNNYFAPGVEIRRYYGTGNLEYVFAGMAGIAECVA